MSAGKTLPSQIVLGTGTMGRTENQTMSVDLAEVKRHVLASGASGSGKTWALKVLLEGLLVRSVAGLVIDTMGDLLGLGLPCASAEEYQRLGLRPPHPLPSDEDWKLVSKIADRLRDTVQVRVLTPCSTAGEQVSILPLTGRPVGYDSYPKDELVLQADAQAANFLARIGVKVSRNGGAADTHEIGVATEVLLRCWEEDMDLTGAEGLQRFGKALIESSKPMLDEKTRNVVRRGLESVEIGRQRLWYDGIPLDFSRLLQVPDGKTPLLLVSLAHLDPADRVFAIGQILHAATNWAAAQGASPDKPRLAVIVDELAGDGGKNPVLPPGSVRSHASGDAIRRILRQGRHYGVCLLAGTQSPGDVDYKSFSQFSTRLVGKVQTPADFDRSIFGVPLDDGGKKRLASFLGRAQPGRMFLLTPSGQFDCIQMRLLGTAHSTIQRGDIERYYANGIWVRHSIPLAPRPRETDEPRAARAARQIEAIIREHGEALSDEVLEHLQSALDAVRGE